MSSSVGTTGTGTGPFGGSATAPSPTFTPMPASKSRSRINVRPILRSSVSRRSTRTPTREPGSRWSDGVSSEMCSRPSRSEERPTKMPKLVTFVTSPTCSLSGANLSRISICQGSSVSCLRPSAMRFLSACTDSTTARTESPFWTTSLGLAIFLVHDMSETCSRPSMPSSSSTNAPYVVRLRTRPSTTVPGGNRPSTSSQGFPSACFMPSEISCFSRLMSSTTTSTSSPTFTTSCGWLMRLLQDISEMWTKPSMPSSSLTNAP